MVVDKKILDELTAKAKENPRLRCNLDLRNSAADQSQRMLNALEPGTVMPIHRHKGTSETCICIRGHFEDYFYDSEGRLTDTIDMVPGGVVLNIEKGQWHSLKCLESGTVLLEAKDGAYRPLEVDDINSLPDSVRLVVQFTAILLMFWSMGLYTASGSWLWTVAMAAVALFFCVGATNIINFMDGINGITTGYAFAMLLPMLLLNGMPGQAGHDGVAGFIEPSYLIVAIIGVLVFSIFNFRPKGKAKCFAGDVGSIGIAFIILFALGRLMLATKDVTWIVFFLVYGVDGSMTIFHRIMLHENLGQAHRKHAYQLMANELGMSHVTVSLIYMIMQLAISLGFIYLCPNTLLAHWVYLLSAAAVLAIAYVLFMKKYYHLHEEYLQSLK